MEHFTFEILNSLLKVEIEHICKCKNLNIHKNKICMIYRILDSQIYF